VKVNILITLFLVLSIKTKQSNKKDQRLFIRRPGKDKISVSLDQ